MFSRLNLFTPLPTPDEMHTWDTLAYTAYGIPPIVLMENASREALDVLRSLVSLTPQTQILIMAGRGNNGGDGFALARHLHNMDCQVLVCHTGTVASLKGPTKEYANMAQLAGINFLPAHPGAPLVLPHEWRSPDVIVDALSGTGLKGNLRDSTLTLIRDINAYRNRSFIFALDTPTGLCGLTGRPSPDAVRAHATVTFEAAKPGLCFPHAQEYTGTLIPRRIGMPTALNSAAPASWQLLSPEPTPDFHLPLEMHKGSAGTVCVIGGSEGMGGAPLLSALGAYKAGAGKVHVACPGALADTLRPGLPESMVHAIGKSGTWTSALVSQLQEMLSHIAPNAIVIGPGMARGFKVRAVIEAVLTSPKRCPVVIDADALDAFSFDEDQGKLPLGLLQQNDILTPHPGEMVRLLPEHFFTPLRKQFPHYSDTQILQKHRPQALALAVQTLPSTIILKGAGTLVGQKSAPTTLCPIAATSLAVAGSGDVLAGAIAALTAVSRTPFHAACLGVYLHARAGEELDKLAPRGHTATEIARMLPYALNLLTTSSE